MNRLMKIINVDVTNSDVKRHYVDASNEDFSAISYVYATLRNANSIVIMSKKQNVSSLKVDQMSNPPTCNSNLSFILYNDLLFIILTWKITRLIYQIIQCILLILRVIFYYLHSESCLFIINKNLTSSIFSMSDFDQEKEQTYNIRKTCKEMMDEHE